VQIAAHKHVWERKDKTTTQTTGSFTGIRLRHARHPSTRHSERLRDGSIRRHSADEAWSASFSSRRRGALLWLFRPFALFGAPPPNVVMGDIIYFRTIWSLKSHLFRHGNTHIRPHRLDHDFIENHNLDSNFEMRGNCMKISWELIREEGIVLTVRRTVAEGSVPKGFDLLRRTGFVLWDSDLPWFCCPHRSMVFVADSERVELTEVEFAELSFLRLTSHYLFNLTVRQP